jgi:anaerobic selenocysteine-containing dehydrogenase
VLTTGRLYAHWHTLTRTAKAEKLLLREPAPFVEVHPVDAGRLSLEAGEPVLLSSRRGTIQLPVRLSAGVSPGMVFVPFHWGDLFGEGNAANYLTISAIGRVAKQPELKFCAVSLEKLTVPRDVKEQCEQGDTVAILSESAACVGSSP